MKVMRKIIEIDEERCDGCGNCVTGCAEGALEVIDGKARVVADRFCDGLGACIGECPQGALTIIEREAEAFDEAAVESHLADKESPAPAGCPSAAVRLFDAAGDCRTANTPQRQDPAATSTLGHWPIQIRLIPPSAPFLKNADLLVLADCGAVTLPALQEEFVRGRVVMMGCPKFDDADDYVERFRQIFAAQPIRSITTVRMEVPCCSGMPRIVQRALRLAGRQVPHEEVVVSTRGVVLERNPLS